MSRDNYITRLRDEIHGNRPGDLSRRRQGAIQEQRVRNGDLRQNQRSLNDGSID